MRKNRFLKTLDFYGFVYKWTFWTFSSFIIFTWKYKIRQNEIIKEIPRCFNGKKQQQKLDSENSNKNSPEAHCSKSQIVQKFNFEKTPTFLRVFTQIFLTIYLVKSKLSTAKESQTTTFSRVFHPKKSTIFPGNQSWIFGQKMKISNSVRRQEIKMTRRFHVKNTFFQILKPVSYVMAELPCASFFHRYSL